MSEAAMQLIDVPIIHRVFIQAEAGRIYDALTTATELDRWFTTGASVDARVGGEIHWRWQNWGPDSVTTEDGGPVLEAQRPQHFVFQWHPDSPDYVTTVEFTIEPVENGSVVQLREHGYHDTLEGRQAMINCATGWGEALTLLKFYVEHNVCY